MTPFQKWYKDAAGKLPDEDTIRTFGVFWEMGIPCRVVKRGNTVKLFIGYKPKSVIVSPQIMTSGIPLPQFQVEPSIHCADSVGVTKRKYEYRNNPNKIRILRPELASLPFD